MGFSLVSHHFKAILRLNGTFSTQPLIIDHQPVSFAPISIPAPTSTPVVPWSRRQDDRNHLSHR